MPFAPLSMLDAPSSMEKLLLKTRVKILLSEVNVMYYSARSRWTKYQRLQEFITKKLLYLIRILIKLKFFSWVDKETQEQP